MMCDNLRMKCIGEKKNYWTSTQEKLQANSKNKKKAEREEGKMSSGEVNAEASPQNKGEGLRTSDGFSWSEESSRVEEGNKDEGQEKKNSQNKEESSLTPREEKGKTDNKAVDKDRDSVQNNAEGDTEHRQRPEIDSRGKEAQLTNYISKRKDETANEDEGTTAKSDKSERTGASEEERLIEQTDMSGDGITEKRKTSTELKMEKVCVGASTGTSSAKPEKSTQSVKRKQKKKKNKSMLKEMKP